MLHKKTIKELNALAHDNKLTRDQLELWVNSQCNTQACISHEVTYQIVWCDQGTPRLVNQIRELELI